MLSLTTKHLRLFRYVAVDEFNCGMNISIIEHAFQLDDDCATRQWCIGSFKPLILSPTQMVLRQPGSDEYEEPRISSVKEQNEWHWSVFPTAIKAELLRPMKVGESIWLVGPRYKQAAERLRTIIELNIPIPCSLAKDVAQYLFPKSFS